PESVLGCARRQDELLEAAGRLVASGGLLVYSTCTFSREENEETLGRFLSRSSDFVTASLPAVPDGEVTAVGSEPQGALRLWPHRFAGAGHFVAALRRVAGGERALSIERRPQQLAESALADFRAFWEASLQQE